MKELLNKVLKGWNATNTIVLLIGLVSFTMSLIFHKFSAIGINANIIFYGWIGTLIVITFLSYFINTRFDRLRHKKVEELASAFLSADAKSDFWFHNNNSLSQYEKNLSANSLKQIWIISKKLQFEKLTSFKEAIKDNISDGINYVYFVPNYYVKKAQRNILKTLIEFSKNKKGSICVIGTDLNSIFYITDYIAIYNPEHKSGENINAYLRIRLSENKLKLGGWAELDCTDEDFETLIDKLTDVKEKYSN